MSTIKEVTIDKDNIYKTDDNITIIGKLKKEWIKTSKQLGSKKLKVIDEFTTQCNCGKHFTTLYILEKDYFTMHYNLFFIFFHNNIIYIINLFNNNMIY